MNSVEPRNSVSSETLKFASLRETRLRRFRRTFSADVAQRAVSGVGFPVLYVSVFQTLTFGAKISVWLVFIFKRQFALAEFLQAARSLQATADW